MSSRQVAKELSWLSFNHRVLQEAMDPTNPPIERARFLGIYSNNLDEYYRVRVAGLRRRILVHQEVGGDPEARGLLQAIQDRTLELNELFEATYAEVVEELEAHDIVFEEISELTEDERAWLRAYFDEHLRPYVCPILVTPTVALADVLADDATYLAVELRRDDDVRYCLIEVPTDHHSRFIELPPERGSRRKPLLLLDDAIRVALPDVFAGFLPFDEVDAWSMKVTRDAEYDLTDEIDESLVDRLSSVLKQRLTAEPTRLVHDREMPERVLAMLKRELGITSIDAVVAGGRHHNMKDFIRFPAIGRRSLRNRPLPAIPNRALDRAANHFDAIRERDVLLHYPYHDFGLFTEWLRQAAMDPDVVSIRISLYRVASSSLVVKALLDAAANGKEVTVVVELTARFDEEANIRWSQVLTEAGVQVSFGILNLKVHSKLCLVTRREGDDLVRYAHIGTGNFNESTGQLYTDFSILTARPEIADEVRAVFRFLEAPYRHPELRHLWVSPLDQRANIVRRIDREITHATEGRPARLIAKVNNLADDEVVEKLYEAGRAGVQVDLIVRGMCTLVPDLDEVDGSIRAISLVDRFLEHPRAFVFFDDGDPEVYISSADWMTRNLDNRVEVSAPVLDPGHRDTIIELLELQLRDNTKARIIDGGQTNRYVPRGNRRKVRSQLATHRHLRTLESPPEG